MRWFAAAVVVLLVGAPSIATSAESGLDVTKPMSSPAGALVAGPRANGTAVLPDGRIVTPVGRVATVDLLPLNLVPSHDGRHVYVTSEGGDDAPTHDNVSNRFVSVLDTSTMQATRVPDDALQYGLAESPDGREVYVSEGETGTVGVFSTGGGTLQRQATVNLDQGDFPWGLNSAPDGRHAFVVGFRGNSLSIIDTASHQQVGRVATGQFPYAVVASADGKRAYVSNWGLYNSSADKVASNVNEFDVPPATIGGYNTDQSSSVWIYDTSDPANPKVLNKVRIGGDIDGFDQVSGSLPSSLALSPDGATLAVTASNADEVMLLNASTGAVERTIDLHVFGDAGPTGAQPNAVTWSPDGRVLFVAEGGRNSVAAVDPSTGVVSARLPTGWYPSAVAVSADGRKLYVASAKGLGAGPNGLNIEAPSDQTGNNPSYIGNLLRGTVQEIDLGMVCGDNVGRLTAAVDADNGFTPSGATPAAAAAATGGDVVPPTFGAGPSDKIKHVVFILKENRTYDQVFGDLAGTERDDRLGIFTGPVTPNQHAVAQQFAHGDNYYDVGQDSFDGHFIIDSGHENEFDQKVHPTVWNADKLGPEGLYVSAPENLPLGGFMWNNLFRHNVNFRIYGEATFLLGLGPTVLNPPSQFSTNPQQLLPQSFALQNHYSLTYPSQITPSRPAFGDGNTDEDRADDFLRELPALDAAGQVPSFMFLWMTDDHTEGAKPGRPTPEYEVARNDHALGRILEGLTHSNAWNDMAVFITEDDPQDGQDHVDAHRTFQLVLSPYVKHGYVSSVHHSNLSTLKTIDLLLGVPPNSTQEASATSMADYFQSTPQADPPFTALPQQVPFATNPPASQAANAQLAAAAKAQEQVPDGLDQGGQQLQEVLRLRHQGAVAAGEAGVPATTDAVEHRLAVGSPQPIALDPHPTGTCPLLAAVSSPAGPAGGVAPGSHLPATGGWPLASAGAALLVTGGLFRRLRRRAARPNR